MHDSSNHLATGRARTRLPMAIFAVLLSCVPSSWAKEEWACTELASRRDEKGIFVCGVGEGDSEAAARSAALEGAQREYEAICKASVDCRGHEVIVDPGRNTCDVQNGRFKCFRGFTYKVTSQLREHGKVSRAELDLLDEQIALKREELELATEKHKKELELERLKSKLLNNDYSDDEEAPVEPAKAWPSSYFLIDGLLGLNGSLEDVTDLPSNGDDDGFFEYGAKLGFRYKRFGFKVGYVGGSFDGTWKSRVKVGSSSLVFSMPFVVAETASARVLFGLNYKAGSAKYQYPDFQDVSFRAEREYQVSCIGPDLSVQAVTPRPPVAFVGTLSFDRCVRGGSQRLWRMSLGIGLQFGIW